MKHDIISDSEFKALLDQHKRQEKFELMAIAVMVVCLFAVACTPVFFQSYFNLF